MNKKITAVENKGKSKKMQMASFFNKGKVSDGSHIFLIDIFALLNVSVQV